MRDFQTQGVILKSRNFLENDKILIVLTRDFGKLEIRAKGAKKILSQFCGHTQTLSICDLALYKSTKDIFTLKQCKQIKTFTRIKQNLYLIETAIRVVESIHLNTAFEQPSEELYKLTVKTLENLDVNPNQRDQTIRTFFMEFLKELGLHSEKNISEVIKNHLHLPQ